MNKRLLLSLYDRAGLGAYMPVDLKGHELQVEEHMEKFVELVVRECLEQVRDEVQYEYDWKLADAVSKRVLEHFGVGE